MQGAVLKQIEVPSHHGAPERARSLLFRRRPKIVFVQSPPSFAVLFVYLYCALTDSRFVVDAHSAAFLYAAWRRPEFLYRH